MPRVLFANNAKSTLSVAVTADTQATLTLQAGDGAHFPAPKSPWYFCVTLDDGTNIEICRCVDVSGDVLTVDRGEEGTVAQASFAANTTKVELRLTEDSLDMISMFRRVSSVKYVRPTANVASWHVLGAILPTVVNSQIAGTLTNSSYRERNERIRLTQANSAQNPIEWRIPQPTFSEQAGYRFLARFGVGAMPNSSHFFIGAVGTTGAVASVHPPTSLTQAIVIGWDNAAYGSNLAIYRNTAGTAVKLDLGSYFNINTQAMYEFEVDVKPLGARIDYVVRRLDVSSISEARSYFTTSLPSNSIWLSPFAHGSTMVASAMAVDHAGFYWES